MTKKYRDTGKNMIMKKQKAKWSQHEGQRSKEKMTNKTKKIDLQEKGKTEENKEKFEEKQ